MLQYHNNVDLSALKQLKTDNFKNPSICHLNINHLRNKIIDLRHVLSKTGLEIVAVSETKLCSEFPNSQFKIQGYSFPPHKKYRAKHEGGLLVLTRNDLVISGQKYRESDQLEIICLEHIISKRKWIIFSLYRPPKQNLSAFLNCTNALDKATRKYENIVLMGSISTENEKSSRN